MRGKKEKWVNGENKEKKRGNIKWGQGKKLVNKENKEKNK